MPSPLYTLTWTNTNPTNTLEEYVSYTSVYGNTTLTNPNAPVSGTTYFIITDATLKHNVYYDFGVSAKCTNLSISSVAMYPNNIKWLVPTGSSSYLGSWGYESTDSVISVWFDSTDLDQCRRIDIGLYDSTGNTLVSGTTIQTFIAPAAPASFADNLKRTVFNGLTEDTTYIVKITLYALQAGGGSLIANTPTAFTVFTKQHNPAYTQFIMVAGNNTSDPCNIKYQFVVQAHPSATENTIIHGVEHLYTNFLTSASLGAIHPFVSPSMNLNYIRLLTGTTVYNYNPGNSTFGAPLGSSYYCLY